MKTGGIDSSQIQAMLAQMKAQTQSPSRQAEAQSNFAMPNPAVQNEAINKQGNTANATQQPADRVDFSAALKGALDQVNQLQNNSKEMGKKFVMGDDSVSLSDVMIAGQKSNISFQATVQVRNKLVSAYSEIMNMQV